MSLFFTKGKIALRCAVRMGSTTHEFWGLIGERVVWGLLRCRNQSALRIVGSAHVKLNIFVSFTLVL